MPMEGTQQDKDVAAGKAAGRLKWKEAFQDGLRSGRQGWAVVTAHQALQTTAGNLAFISRAIGRHGAFEWRSGVV